MLYSSHMMLATFLKVEAIAITDAEANKLGAAVNRVAQLYDVPLLSEKQMAWFQLATVAGGIYGPRFMASKMKPKLRVMEKPAVDPGSIRIHEVVGGVDVSSNATIE